MTQTGIEDASRDLADQRVSVQSYIVRPTGYDDLVHSDKDSWCLHVIDGHAWGWSVRSNPNSARALNHKGQWVYESRGSGSNKFRRWTAQEALALALKYVDVLKINGYTAEGASAEIAARLAAEAQIAATGPSSVRSVGVQ